MHLGLAQLLPLAPATSQADRFDPSFSRAGLGGSLAEANWPAGTLRAKDTETPACEDGLATTSSSDNDGSVMIKAYRHHEAQKDSLCGAARCSSLYPTRPALLQRGRHYVISWFLFRFTTFRASELGAWGR